MNLSAHEWHVILAFFQGVTASALTQADLWLHPPLSRDLARQWYMLARWAVIVGIVAYAFSIDVLLLPLDTPMLLAHVVLVPSAMVAARWVEIKYRGF